MRVTSHVHRTRRDHFSGIIHGIVDVAPPLGLVAGSNFNFFQYHHTYYDNGYLKRIIGWAHPHLLELLRYPGTEICVFVPVVYTWTANQITSTYNRMFGFIADAVGLPLQHAQLLYILNKL
ncbi:hypothetical protein PHMEG_0006791 [Phytophthora megakarya]|uniref:Uncharacterized protein n=1 Tax=Phytophthora megakarya TaxID=4795 RepID=A0A225WQ69_9STRA|nr:hypothetical protein PHMEG_0006791 [Phytophthora megakarya]